MTDKLERVVLFQFCIDNLNLTDRETMLMREILHQIEVGDLQLWGQKNQRLAGEVHDLFEKCKCLIGSTTE